MKVTNYLPTEIHITTIYNYIFDIHDQIIISMFIIGSVIIKPTKKPQPSAPADAEKDT